MNSTARDFRIYKPRKSGEGCASSLNITKDNRTAQKRRYPTKILFWEIAGQLPDKGGNSQFDWSNKEGSKSIAIKLEATDIGQLLSVIYGKEASCQLYHEHGSTNTIFKFFSGKDGNYTVAVSSQNKKTKQMRKYSHSLTVGEAIVLKVLFESFIEYKYGWTTALDVMEEFDKKFRGERQPPSRPED
jgi:hypothetical protein